MITLNLPSITVEKVEHVDKFVHIYARSNEVPKRCPHCTCRDFYVHGNKRQLIMDEPHGSRKVGLLLRRERYKCQDQWCKKTFMQGCSDVNESHRATNRLIEYIHEVGIEEPFTWVAERVGLTEGNIRKIVLNYINQTEKKYSFETPSVLGIDELHLNKTMRLILTNIEENTVIDLIEDRTKKTVINALTRLKDRDKIKFVAMDMWRPYKEAVYAVLPHAVIVIDKFHIVKMANEAVEKGRKSLRESMTAELALALKNDRFVMLRREERLSPRQSILLSGWTENYPKLKELHRLKEEFFSIFDSRMPRAQAEAAYAAWEQSIPEDLAHFFKPLTTAVNGWHREVFNYFDTWITNAYTESANKVIKGIYNLGRGYSFKVLRAKTLYIQAEHKEKMSFKKSIPKGVLGFTEKPTYLNYGVVIPHDDEN